mmetsp:Transcript_60528/g.167729  ORF Transcript_60528/g.167729 Transcript_60528/m.167729 type:complete len:203 (-) Transcript_60528:294-902(-)
MKRRYFSSRLVDVHASISFSATLALQPSEPAHGHQSSVTRPSSTRCFTYIVMQSAQALCASRPQALGTTQPADGTLSRQMLHRCVGTTGMAVTLTPCLFNVPETVRPICTAQLMLVVCVRSRNVRPHVTSVISEDVAVALLPMLQPPSRVGVRVGAETQRLSVTGWGNCGVSSGMTVSKRTWFCLSTPGCNVTTERKDGDGS